MTPTRCVGGYEIAVDLIRPDMTPRELAAAQRETLARFDAVTPFMTNDELAAVHPAERLIHRYAYRRLARRGRRHWRLPVLWLAVGGVLVALLFIAIPAFAQEPPPCGPRDDILGDLKSGCGEQVASRGIDGNGRMVEIVGNPETGTWSEVTTTGDGMSCLTKAGEGFTLFAILPGEPL